MLAARDCSFHGARAAPASEAPAIIELPYLLPPVEPALQRRNGRPVSTKRGSQISRLRRVADPKSEVITFRCTAAEYELFEVRATAAGLAIGPYLRQRETGTTGPSAHLASKPPRKKFLITTGAKPFVTLVRPRPASERFLPRIELGFLYLISTFCVRKLLAVRAPRAPRDLTRPPLLMLRPAVDADVLTAAPRLPGQLDRRRAIESEAMQVETSL